MPIMPLIPPTLHMSTTKVCIGLSNPKSPSNVGAVMRAAGCFQAQHVFYTGTRFDRANSFATDTQKVSSRIPLTKVPDLILAAPTRAKIVCVELALGANSLTEFQHPEEAYYIFGPEDGTLDQSILNQANSVLYIPTQGCLNLAATVNILLYDRLAKSHFKHLGDDLIIKSRDTNNTASVHKAK